MARVSKNQKVLSYLSSGKTLTVKKAKKKLGIDQVGKQIYALRVQGYNIVSYLRRPTSIGAPRVTYVLEAPAFYIYED